MNYKQGISVSKFNDLAEKQCAMLRALLGIFIGFLTNAAGAIKIILKLIKLNVCSGWVRETFCKGFMRKLCEILMRV